MRGSHAFPRMNSPLPPSPESPSVKEDMDKRQRINIIVETSLYEETAGRPSVVSGDEVREDVNVAVDNLSTTPASNRRGSSMSSAQQDKRLYATRDETVTPSQASWIGCAR